MYYHLPASASLSYQGFFTLTWRPFWYFTETEFIHTSVGFGEKIPGGKVHTSQSGVLTEGSYVKDHHCGDQISVQAQPTEPDERLLVWSKQVVVGVPSLPVIPQNLLNRQATPHPLGLGMLCFLSGRMGNICPGSVASQWLLPWGDLTRVF